MRVFVGIYVVWLAALSTTVALAADPAAESLFRDALALMKGDNFDDACPKLEASQKIEPRSGTLISLAYCHEKQGKTATAWAEYRDAQTLATTAKRDEHVEKAKTLAAAIEPKLSKLTVTAASIAGLQLFIDGKAMAVGSLGSALPIDPGEHDVSARAPGHRTWSTTITVGAEADRKKVDVPFLEPEPEPEPAGVVGLPHTPPSVLPPPVAGAPAPVAPPPDDGTAVPTVSWISFGIGAAGLVVGSITGIVALSKAGDLEDSCGGTICDAEFQSDFDSGAALANVSTAAFIIGGIGVATGVTTLLLFGDEPGNSAQVQTVVLPGYVGVAGRF
jgi:hypothetical protein